MTLLLSSGRPAKGNAPRLRPTRVVTALAAELRVCIR